MTLKSFLNLLKPKPKPRIDLLGEDASFEAGTGARKALIDEKIMEQYLT